MGELRAHFRALAVADRLDQEIPQRPPLELQLPEHVEHLAAERLACSFELVEQRAVYVTLAGLLGDHVPEVANLGLPDAVDAAEALLETVGVPGQVVVHHKVRPLEVDAFAGGVGGEKDLDHGIVEEGFLRFAALLAPLVAVDHGHRLGAAKERRDAILQIGQCVAVLGEDHELLSGRGRRAREVAGTIGLAGFRDAVRDSSGREDLA
jgi:hypothetical protein